MKFSNLVKIKQKKIEKELKKHGVYKNPLLRQLVYQQMLNGLSVEQAIDQLARSLEYISPFKIKISNKKLLEDMIDE